MKSKADEILEKLEVDLGKADYHIEIQFKSLKVAFRKLLELIKNPWTPFSVALPEKNRCYWGTLKYPHDGHKAFEIYFDGEQFWRFMPDGHHEDVTQYVLAWTELPEPWEGNL